jgi:N-acetylmuramoyl-L-alanine amidase
VDVSSVLTEVSCLSNKAEEEKLGTEEYREEIAHFLEEGILDYLNRIKKGDLIYETNRTD